MPTLKSAALAFSWPSNAYTLLRHRWLIGAMVLFSAALAAFVGAVKTRAYVGDALVQVEPQQVPDRLVSSPVGGEWQDRLASLSQQVLTSDHLRLVLQEFRLFPAERRRVPLDEVLATMRRHTEIRLERTWTRERPDAFHVTFEYSDPVLAAAVANHLARALIDLNLRGRKISASGASDFLDSQLHQSRRDLELQDARLTLYRLAHVGGVPGQEGVLAAALNRLQLQWQSSQESLARLEQSRLIASDALYTAQMAPPPPVAVPDAAAEALRRQLNAVRSRYSDRHPEVRMLQAEALADVVETPRPVVDDPRLRQRVATLVAQLRANADERVRLTRSGDELLLQISAYQTRLERMPLQEVQWNSLNSDHEVARQKYLSLLEKHSVAQLSAELERRQKDETFRMLEPARAPAEPKGFRWPAFALIGSLCGLLAGAAAAFACDLGRDVIQGDWELPAGIAFLGRVPELGAPAPAGRRTRARRQLRALRTATGLGLVLMLLRRVW